MAHSDQMAQILAALTEQSERMSHQEQFATQQNAAIITQTEALQRLQQENQDYNKSLMRLLLNTQRMVKHTQMIYLKNPMFLKEVRGKIMLILKIIVSIILQESRRKNQLKLQLILVIRIKLRRSI